LRLTDRERAHVICTALMTLFEEGRFRLTCILPTRKLPGIRQVIEVSDVATPASVIRYSGNW
jgi:hypothetical protein